MKLYNCLLILVQSIIAFSPKVHMNARMAMASEVHSRISKRTSLVIGGNLAVDSKSGIGAATAVLSHQISPVSQVELMSTIGLQSLIGIQTSRWNDGLCLYIFSPLNSLQLLTCVFPLFLGNCQFILMQLWALPCLLEMVQ